MEKGHTPAASRRRSDGYRCVVASMSPSRRRCCCGLSSAGGTDATTSDREVGGWWSRSRRCGARVALLVVGVLGVLWGCWCRRYGGRGAASAAGHVDLLTQANVRLEGAATNDLAGLSVTGAEDVNAGGHADVIVGARFGAQPQVRVEQRSASVGVPSSRRGSSTTRALPLSLEGPGPLPPSSHCNREPSCSITTADPGPDAP